MQELLRVAEQHLQVRMTDDAAITLTEARDIAPGRPEPWDMVAALEKARGDTASALAAHRTAWKLDPSPDRGLRLARMLMGAQRREILLSTWQSNADNAEVAAALFIDCALGANPEESKTLAHNAVARLQSDEKAFAWFKERIGQVLGASHAWIRELDPTNLRAQTSAPGLIEREGPLPDSRTVDPETENRRDLMAFGGLMSLTAAVWSPAATSLFHIDLSKVVGPEVTAIAVAGGPVLLLGAGAAIGFSRSVDDTFSALHRLVMSGSILGFAWFALLAAQGLHDDLLRAVLGMERSQLSVMHLLEWCIVCTSAVWSSAQVASEQDYPY